jgi:small nuclear ribonucleoprotein (snRNP)-like protein
MLISTQVFLNIVLDDAVEEKDGGEKVRLGMVVCSLSDENVPFTD